MRILRVLSFQTIHFDFEFFHGASHIHILLFVNIDPISFLFDDFVDFTSYFNLFVLLRFELKIYIFSIKGCTN